MRTLCQHLTGLMAAGGLLLVTAPHPAYALQTQSLIRNQQSPARIQTLSVDEITRRLTEANASRKAALKQYESRRVMLVNYDGPLSQGEASETVQMTFTAPDTKRFSVVSSTGPQLIRDAVFQRALGAEASATSEQAQRATALNLDNYTMSVVGIETLPAGACYVLDVVPRMPGELLYVGRVWVQASDFAVVRIHGRPSINPSQWTSDGEFTTDFQKISNFYLPRQTVSTSKLPLGMRARLTIQYGPYRILSPSSPTE